MTWEFAKLISMNPRRTLLAGQPFPTGNWSKTARLKPAGNSANPSFSKGVDVEQPITTTCGSGVTAAVLTLGLEIIGGKNISLYDGSRARICPASRSSHREVNLGAC